MICVESGLFYKGWGQDERQDSCSLIPPFLKYGCSATARQERKERVYASETGKI